MGQRVVIRRLLPGETGPSGGPAMTDVLGICTSWEDGRAVVRREDGEVVVIDTASIVSGKPVPPRPSIRHRVSPLEAQRRAFALFPDLQTIALGDWTLRASASHHARRANSVLAMSSPEAPRSTTRPVEAPVQTVVEWYAARGTPPIAAVLPDSPEQRIFEEAGWVPESAEPDTQFLIASVAHTQRTKLSSDGVDLTETDGLAVATITVGDAVIAEGVAAYFADWVGFRSIAVHPSHFRAGHATAIMAALIEWGAEQGATTAYLQVLGDNAPALALYGRLGFSLHHSYRYLTLTDPLLRPAAYR